MSNSKKWARIACLTSFTGAFFMVFSLALIHVPEAEGARGGGGGARAGGGGRGASVGSRGSVRHASASRNRGAQRSSSGTQRARSPGKNPSKAATPGRKASAGPGRKASPGPGRSRVGGPGGSRRGYGRYNARKDARRDYRRWRRNRALFAVGVSLLTRPRYSTTVIVGGTSYYYWGGVYYVSSGTRYVVVVPPPQTIVYAVPTYTTVVYAGTVPYYYAGNAYYIATDAPAPKPEIPDDVVVEESEENPPMIEDEHNFEVVEAPIGATVTYLPDEAEQKVIDSTTYFVYEGTYYRVFVSEGDTIYQVVEDPVASG